jgi:plasmid stabilization system protein ParE
MTPRFEAAARADFDRATDWYGRHGGASVGEKFVATVERLVAQIVVMPSMFGMVPRPPVGREVRQVKVGRYDYILTYEVRPPEVIILSIGHARRKSQPWRRRLRP